MIVLDRACKHLPEQTIAILINQFETIVFVDGSAARRIDGTWRLWLQACEQDGEAGVFLGMVKNSTS